MNLYDIPVTTLEGQPATLAPWRGQVLLIVNVASRCGFTPQYAGLEQLHRRYRDRGFAVLGFPCNQFGAQEPGTAEEIRQFCSLTYDLTFPLFAKVDVNGAGSPALPAPAPREARPPRLRGDQVELHQVPRRSGRQGRRALRAERRAVEPSSFSIPFPVRGR